MSSFAYLKGVVREWSRLLHEATGGRLYVGSVDVVVPQSWNDAGDDCRRVRNVAPTQLADYADADVRVGVSHPLFGDVPFTQQSRDCAHQGDFISISDAFFDDAVGANITDMWIHGKSSFASQCYRPLNIIV